MRRLPASVLVVVGVAGLFSAGVASFVTALPAPEGDLLLALVPPWHAAESVVATAGGRIAAPFSAPLAVLVTGTTAARLQDAGAVWVADGRLAARLCGLK